MDIENFPTSESGLRMLEMVTKGFYEKSYVAKWLYQVMGLEIDSLYTLISEIPKQIFPETATWGLMYHEQKWQIPIRENLTYEERRRLIYQKRDCRAPMTPYRMEKYLADAIGFDVHVCDCHDTWDYDFQFPHPNVFRVVFVGEGTLNAKKAIEVINQLKQSHTTYIIDDLIITILGAVERVYLNGIDIYIRLPFFDYRAFDGSWTLGGTVDLGRVVICTIDTGIIFGKIEMCMDNHVAMGALDVGFGLGRIKIEHAHGIQICFGLDNRNIFCIDAKMDFSVSIHENERIGNVLVTIKKDLWHLDGMKLLDGSKNLDAEIRMEEL